MTRKVTIEFLGEDKTLGKTMSDVDSKSGKLSGTLAKVGKAAALGLAAGAVAGAAGLVKLTQGAMEDQAAQEALATTLKNTAGATDKQVAGVEKWISAQGKALGVTDDELRPALQRLAEATGDVGKAQELASLAMDVSAGTGKSLKTVSEALMKAQNGQVSGLSRLGIETKNAAGETLTFEQATKKMGETFGGQAATKAETLQGKMDRLKLILAETGETIGSKMIPVVTSMADWFLAKGLPAVTAFGGWLSQNLVPALESVGQKVSSIAGFLNEHRTALLAAAVAVGALVAVTQIHAAVMAVQAAGGLAAMIRGLPIVTTLTKVWTAVQWAANAALSANPIGLVIAALVALGVGLALAWQHSETFREIVTTALDKVRNAATAVGNFFTSTLPAFFRDAWASAKSHTTDGIDKIHGWVTGVPGKISAALSSLLETTRGLFGDAFEAGKTKVESVGGAIVSWVGGIPGKIRTALSGLLGDVRDLFDGAMGAGLTKVQNIGGTIVGWIEGIPGKLLAKVGDFKSAGASLIGAVVDGMKNAAGIIEGIASNVWSAIKGLLNGAIDRINAALSFTISLPGPDLHVDVGNIGHLARGTNNWRGGLAVVGEEGPELVNLPRGSRVTPHGESMGALRGMAQGGGAPIVVQLVLPGGQVIEQLLIKHTRDKGRPLQVKTLGPA